MARRARVVRADSQVPGVGPDGEEVLIPQVSLQALANVVLEGVTVLNFSGGVLEVVVSRVPTGFPEERVTNAAIVRWKDRTDARPQPESDSALELAVNGNEPPVPEVAAEFAPDEPLDEAPDVDESAVPARLRGA